MLAKLIIAAAFVGVALSDTCIHCICLRESGCRPIGCAMDVGSLSCGYFQIKIPYYQDCGEPGKNPGESTDTAWRRCADDLSCATTCVQRYVARYKGGCSGLGDCQTMSRLHNGGPNGCRISGTVAYWNAIHNCCGCN